MKSKIIKVAIYLLSFTAVNFTMAQDPNFHIYICFGQSNMDGSADIQSQDKTVDARFQVLQSVTCSNLSRTQGNWYAAKPPLSRCWNGLSPADYFGRTMVENLPEEIKIGVINVSVSGCKLELFDKDLYESYLNTYTDQWYQDIVNAYDRNPYAHLVKMAKQAQKDGVIKGILLHQGESNNGDAQWPNKVKKIYEDLISDLELTAEEIPLLAGEVAHADQGGSLAGMNSIIDKLPNTLANSYVISSSGCPVKSDKIHFNSEGVRELGKRYADQMLEILGVVIPEPVPLGWQQPLAFSFESVFPNPTAGKIQLRFSLPHHSLTQITIYDLAGHEVLKLLDKTLNTGTHQIEATLDELQAGVYLIRLEAETNAQTQRLVIR